MTTRTPHTGFTKAGLQDPFLTGDIAANWDKADRSLGEFICTSSTRPLWTGANEGQSISETDTGLSWKWIGGQFVRRSGAGGGLLGTTTGGKAFVSQDVNVTAALYPPAYVAVLAVTNVVVPPGNRALRITANMPTIKIGGYEDGDNRCTVAIMRSQYSDSGVVEQERVVNGFYASSQGSDINPRPSNPNFYCSGQTLTTTIPGGLDAGVYSWSVQVKGYPLRHTALSVNSTATDNTTIPNETAIPGAASIPCQILVEEI